MQRDERDERDWPERRDAEAADRDADAADRDDDGPDEPAREPARDAQEPRAWPEEDLAGARDEFVSAEAETTEAEPADAAQTRPWEAPPGETWETSAAEPRDTADLPPQPAPADAESWDAAPSREPSPDPEHRPPSEVESFEAMPEERQAPPAAHAVPATDLGEATRCPRCGTENRPGLAFCRNCGQRLVAAGVAPTVERPGAPEGTQQCPRCGTHNRAGTAFCQNCGANLRGVGEPGYVPPPVAAERGEEAPERARRGAILGPIVLLIGAVGIVTAWLLPFEYGEGSLYDRSFGGADGYGLQFWNAYPEVTASLADQAYFGFAAPAPILAALLVVLAIAGFVRAAPGLLQVIGLIIALLWSVGLAVLFVVVEVAGKWGGNLVPFLADLTPGGIIFFLASLIVIIGSLTRFGRG